MAIRNVGNNTPETICDFQNDVKGAKETAHPIEPAIASTSTPAPALPANSQGTSLRARNTLSSRSVKAALDAKLGGAEATSRQAVGRQFQPAVNNIVNGAAKLMESAGKYSKSIETKLVDTKNLTNQFLGHADDAKKSLMDGLTKLIGKPTELISKVESLVKQLTSVTSHVKGSSNELIGNVSRSLKELTLSTQGFQKTANLIAKGQAMALPKAMDFHTAIAAVPGKISNEAVSFGKSVTSAVTPLAANAKSLASAVDSDVDSFSFGSIGTSIKNAAINLADKAYNFTYNIKEKVGSFIDEYMGPLTKALGNGFKNLWNSIFSPDKNPNGKSVDLNALVSGTQDLRNTIAAAKSGNPTAVANLQKNYGYTPATAPKPGQMWVAANFAGGDLESGNKVTAKHFPGTSGATQGITAAPKQPPTVNQLLFGQWRPDGKTKPLTLQTSEGLSKTVGTMEDYKKVVADNRAKLGMPVQGGEPIPVHLSLEGGGGKGKRYAAAFEEMYNIGVVPASVSGTSAGAIAAALVAGGLDPRQTDDIAKDPALKKFFDATFEGPGVLEGRELYRFMDQKLRELTGITDRPVTFADLPMPLNLIATKLADSQAPNDMTKLEDRLFVFSKENTPNTPVAMAVVASTAIPGAFDPVEYVDVATGRTIRLCDGGVLDNLPIGYQHNNLPEVAIQLNEPNDNSGNPRNAGSPQPFPPGNLISNNPFGNAKFGLDLQAKADTGQRDFHDRIDPKPGTFILNVPTWNLQDFSKQDSTFGFEYDYNVDPALDTQTAKVTQDFFRTFLGKLQDPNASGTNLKPSPANNSFTRTVQAEGHTWTVSHNAGSDEINLRSDTGRNENLKIGNSRLNDWVTDDASFGDLNSRLRDVISDHESFLRKVGLGI